jgi:ligand-binding sensor protein
MHIFDFRKENEWIELIDNFSKETLLATAVFDSENNLLIKSGRRNGLCLHIKNYSQSQAAICSLAQSNLALIAKKQRIPVIDFCDANCIKVVIPYFIENVYVGGITGCGCRLVDEPLNLEYIAELTASTMEHLQHYSVAPTSVENLNPVVAKYSNLMSACR